MIISIERYVLVRLSNTASSQRKCQRRHPKQSHSQGQRYSITIYKIRFFYQCTSRHIYTRMLVPVTIFTSSLFTSLYKCLLPTCHCNEFCTQKYQQREFRLEHIGTKVIYIQSANRSSLNAFFLIGSIQDCFRWIKSSSPSSRLPDTGLRPVHATNLFSSRILHMCLRLP